MLLRQPKFVQLLLILASIVLLVLLVSLGFWQLDRAQQKRKLLSSLKNGPASNTVLATNLDDGLKLLSGVQNSRVQQSDHPKQGADTRPKKVGVKLLGRFHPRFNLLQDNQFYQGQLGYRVFSLFEEKDSTRSLWIDRGWVAQGRDKNQHPSIPSIKGEVAVKGNLAHWSINEWQPEIKTITSWPLVVIRPINQVINKQIERELGRQVSTAILTVESTSPYVFTFSERIKNLMSPEKHTAYAFQWFSLALTLVLLCTVFYFRQIKQVDIQSE